MSLSFHDQTSVDSGSLPGPPTGPTFSQRVVHRAAGLFSTRRSRRSFLTRTAVVGSALAVNPWGFILRPGTAYGALCGTCNDGWTAFCCTINAGKNSCPPGSFVAGWWKADNAAFCCGSARYIIDCNANCPTQCKCRCSGASCDGRRTCCNQFRYGQCHQEIACFGPVVCRVATCTPPWRYDASCTTTSATDNNTVTHGAPCMPDECASPIGQLYRRLGGAAGVLGGALTAEKATADGSGRYSLYAKGSIFARNGKHPFEAHGPIAELYAKLQYHRGGLKFPTSNQGEIGDSAKGVFNRFENGVIYSAAGIGTREVLGAIRLVHSSSGGVKGALGYPTSGTLADAKTDAAASGTHQHFQKGSIWSNDLAGTWWLAGAIRARYMGLGAVKSPLGWPTSGHVKVSNGTMATFTNGAIYLRSASAAEAFELSGPLYDRYIELGETSGPLGFPTSSPVETVGGLVTATFETGSLTLDPATGAISQS